MAVNTNLTWHENVGKDKVIAVYSDATDNLHAIQEIDQWAQSHGYVRSREAVLNVMQSMDGKRYFYCACYLLDENDFRAVNADLSQIRERREQMAMTASSADLRRDED